MGARGDPWGPAALSKRDLYNYLFYRLSLLESHIAFRPQMWPDRGHVRVFMYSIHIQIRRVVGKQVLPDKFLKSDRKSGIFGNFSFEIGGL